MAALADWLASRTGSIGLYAAMPREPNLASLHVMGLPTTFCYPRTAPGGVMDFHRIDDPDTMVAGPFGIREPNPACHPMVAPSELAALVCPGLAFTTTGARLGRGGGFYDRYLARIATGIPLLGVAFPCQFVPEVPVDAHDVHMTHLVTESGVIAVEPA